LASGSQDTTIVLWDAATGKGVRRIGSTKGVANAMRSVLGQLGMGLPARLRAPTDAVQALAFSPDGRTLASGGGSMGDGVDSVQLWEVSTGSALRTLVGHRSCVYDVAFSPDGKLLASGSHDKTIRLWEVATGKELWCCTGHDDWVHALAFAPDGRTLASGSADGTIRLWELATRKERRCFTGHQGWVMSVAFSPDGTALASSGWDTTALLWDLTGHRPAGHWRQVRLSPDELGRLWDDLAAEDAVRAYRAVWSLAASPQEALILLRQRVRPIAAMEPQRLAQLLADLDSARFEVRQRATSELEQLGELAEPALAAALGKQPPLERRQRLERLRSKVGTPSGERLRALRSVEILGHIGTAPAKEVLESLAGGLPEARLTQEARAALTRLPK